jgi:Multimeric flavodoxin WrbA
MKMAVLYYSKTGNTQKMAEVIVKGMETVAGVEAKSFALDNIDEGFVKECGCVVLGSPIYVATICGPVKTWLESSARPLNLAGKIGGAFATADYVHGGGDIGIQSILSHMLVYGMLAYSGGAAHGKPVIHLGPVALTKDIEQYFEAFTTYGQRMAQKTMEVFGK